MTWDDVLKRDDLVGGEIELQLNGDVVRGPISAFRREEERIVIEAGWWAVMKRGSPKWQAREDHEPLRFNTGSCRPGNIGGGRFVINAPGVAVCVIYPRGCSKLDPGKVEGLKFAVAG